MSESAITVRGLSKVYQLGERGEVHDSLREVLTTTFRSAFSLPGRRTKQPREQLNALDGVSFDVSPGEVVGVLGANGAGKSTLLKVLSRITDPSAGEAHIRGRVGSLLEVGTGFHRELTGRENINLSGAILGMRRQEIQRRFDEIVDFAEVEKFIDTPVKHYSSGMYLRLAFSVAAHLEPDVLLVDEVLAVGDLKFQQKCLGKMDDIAHRGRTVLFVSHNLAAVKELCSRALVLDQGQLVFDGSAVEGVAHYSGCLVDSDRSYGGNGWSGVHVATQEDQTVDNRSPLVVTANLTLEEDLNHGRLFLLIDDCTAQNLVHNTFWIDSLEGRCLPAGNHRIRIELPPLWLIPDLYTVHFKLIADDNAGRSVRQFSERVLLNISSTGDQNAGVGRLNAKLIPDANWRIEAGQTPIEAIRQKTAEKALPSEPAPATSASLS